MDGACRKKALAAAGRYAFGNSERDSSSELLNKWHSKRSMQRPVHMALQFFHISSHNQPNAKISFRHVEGQFWRFRAINSSVKVFQITLPEKSSMR